MSKIILPEIGSGYNVTTINGNFKKIEDAINERILFRDNPQGEPNQLKTDIDANSKRIYNLPVPVLDHEAARYQDVKNAVQVAGAALAQSLVYRNEAEAFALEAEQDAATVAANIQLAIEIANSMTNNDFFRFGTKAAAASYGLEEGQFAEIFVDESQGGGHTVYQMVSGSLVLKLNYNALIIAFRALVASDAGSANIGIAQGGTLAEYLKNSVERVVDSVEALKLISPVLNTSVRTLGYYAPGDQGGGLYRYDSSDTTTVDNGGTTIIGLGGARWKLVYNGVIEVRQFGAKGIGATYDDTPHIQAAFDAANQSASVFVNPGAYSCTDLYYGNQNPAGNSIAPTKLYGTGLTSSFLSRPGTTTLFNAVCIVGNIIEYIVFYVDPNNVSEWGVDTSWVAGSGPSVNNTYNNVWVRGYGQIGSWKADNNNDCALKKCVIEGGVGKIGLQIIASGGAVALTECIISQAKIRAYTQNLLINGGYNFGIEFQGIINSVTINNSYMYANQEQGAIFWQGDGGGTVTMIVTGGLFITHTSGEGTPGMKSILNCPIGSDCYFYNVNYVGAPQVCRVLGPGCVSTVANQVAKVHLMGGTVESGVYMDYTETSTVYLNVQNLRDYLGYANMTMQNFIAPDRKGETGALSINDTTYSTIVAQGVLASNWPGTWLLKITMISGAAPFQIHGSTMVPLVIKVGANQSGVANLVYDSYLGVGGILNVRASISSNPNQSPGIELKFETGSLSVDNVKWSLKKLADF